LRKAQHAEIPIDEGDHGDLRRRRERGEQEAAKLLALGHIDPAGVQVRGEKVELRACRVELRAGPLGNRGEDEVGAIAHQLSGGVMRHLITHEHHQPDRRQDDQADPEHQHQGERHAAPRNGTRAPGVAIARVRHSLGSPRPGIRRGDR